MRTRLPVLLALLMVLVAAPAFAQRPDTEALVAAQREAMKRLAVMDGMWRGPAWMTSMDDEKREFVQTERVGTMLGGSVRVIEGRGYEADGSLSFNAFGIVSFAPQDSTFTLRSYALGQAGDFPFTPTADGFTWDISAGPVTIHYTAVVKDGTWRETGDRSFVGQDPVRFFEMTLTRVGDTDWPAGGAVPPK